MLNVKNYPIVTTLSVFLVALLSLSLSQTAAGESQREVERRTKQAELDHACELARQEKLAPVRRKIYAECMQKRNEKRIALKMPAPMTVS